MLSLAPPASAKSPTAWVPTRKQGAKIAVTADNDANLYEIPADTEAPNVNGYRENSLHKEYYCFHAEFLQYKTKSTNGVPDAHLKAQIRTLVSILAYYIKAIGGFFPSSLIKRTQPPKPLPA